MKDFLMQTDNVVIIQLIGIVTVLIVQVAQTARAYITARVSSNQNEKIILDFEEFKVKNKKEHISLIATIDKVVEKIEHNSFIPAFEIAIEIYIKNIVSGFSFNSRNFKTLMLSDTIKYKDIFTNILKFSFEKYSDEDLRNNFDVQNLGLPGKLDYHKIKVDKNKLISIIKLEQESYLIGVKQIIEFKTNGDRQDAFNKLCRNFIFNIIKEISAL